MDFYQVKCITESSSQNIQICIKSIIVKIKIKILHGSVTSFGSEMNRRVKASMHNTERELFQSIYSI